MFSQEVVEAAQRHARAEFPKESCGLVVGGVYHLCRNVAEDPEKDFIVHPQDQAKALTKGKLQAVIHSHPGGPAWPTQADMEGQLKTGVPWAIIPLLEDRMGEPLVWGADTPIPPMIGRQFVHGITDCYSIIRDTFRLGREELAKQDIVWPFDPIELPEVPRDDAWWLREDQDLYMDLFQPFGFEEINFKEARAGDVFLINVNSPKVNHGGVLLGNNLLMQHFPGRLSRREPAGLWARQATVWLRYKH